MKYQYSLLCCLCLLFISSCASQAVFPSQWRSFPEDKQEGIAVVNTQELYRPQRKAVFFITQVMPAQCGLFQDTPLTELKSYLHTYGDFLIVHQVKGAKYQDMQQVWQSLANDKADYAILVKLNMYASCKQGDIAAKIDLRIFSKQEGNKGNQIKMTYTQKDDDLAKQAKSFLRKQFPLRALVLATREKGKYIQIGAGQSRGVSPNDEFKLYPIPDRNTLAALKAHVVYVDENTAWLQRDSLDSVLRGYYAYSTK